MKMKAHVIWQPETDDFRVYLVDESTPFDASLGHLFAPNERGELERQPRDAFPAKPVFRCPGEVLRAFGAALYEAGFVPKPQAVTEEPALRAHLADAIVVRDRLLVLAERKR